MIEVFAATIACLLMVAGFGKVILSLIGTYQTRVGKADVSVLWRVSDFAVGVALMTFAAMVVPA